MCRYIKYINICINTRTTTHIDFSVFTYFFFNSSIVNVILFVSFLCTISINEINFFLIKIKQCFALFYYISMQMNCI